MNWDDWFIYDETSPSCLRWKVKGGTARKIGDIAGHQCKTHGYWEIRAGGKGHKGHRIVWEMHYGPLNGQMLDHKDGNRADNRITNLRIATLAQNSANKGPRKGREKEYKGVTWFRNYQKWCCRIRKDGKLLHLGYFLCKHEAARAYNMAAFILFGEFARLNKIEGNNANP